MRKKRTRAITLAGLAIILLAAVIWLSLPRHEPEPIYQGRPLSDWLKGYDYLEATDGPQDKPGAELAVRELGTNCIPTLLRMMREKGSISRVGAAIFAYELHLTKQQPPTGSEHNYQACQAFRVLGAQASNAVPALIEIYQEKANGVLAEMRQGYAIVSLGAIGKPAAPAVPALLHDLADSNSIERLPSIRALGYIRVEPELVVPALIGLLKDADQPARTTAVAALGDFGTDAKPAIPQLYELLTNQGFYDSNVRDALLKIDPDAPAKLQKYPPPPE